MLAEALMYRPILGGSVAIHVDPQMRTQIPTENRRTIITTYPASIACHFVQDNQSSSKRGGTLRGLHFQLPPVTQAKLVSVFGGILDVAVDERHGWGFAMIHSDKGHGRSAPLYNPGSAFMDRGKVSTFDLSTNQKISAIHSWAAKSKRDRARA